MRDNILKDIYLNNKVELSSMDVELALIDDLNKETENIIKLASVFYKQRNLIISEVKTAKTQAETYLSESKKIVDLLSNIKKKYNELGLDFEKNPAFEKARLHVLGIKHIEQVYEQIKKFNLVGI